MENDDGESHYNHCKLDTSTIREILGYVHDHLRYIVTKHGLHGENEVPKMLSIHAILNARLMDYFKDVLLGKLYREQLWSIVESNVSYIDIIPWLRANRCPYVYDDETIKTANEYGRYRYFQHTFWPFNYRVYEGMFKDGRFHGQGQEYDRDFNGKVIYEGLWSNGKKSGQGKCLCFQDDVNWYRDIHRICYEGEWKDDNIIRHGKGKLVHSVDVPGKNITNVIDGEWEHDKFKFFANSVFYAYVKFQNPYGQSYNNGKFYIDDIGVQATQFTRKIFVMTSIIISTSFVIHIEDSQTKAKFISEALKYTLNLFYK